MLGYPCDMKNIKKYVKKKIKILEDNCGSIGKYEKNF